MSARPAGTGSAPHAAARGERWTLAAILGFAFALRLWHLGMRSLWTDEGSTWTAASGSIPALLHHCATLDASPPLYYLLTWATLRLGDSEAFLRLTSALASVALVWLAYRLARLAAPRSVATLAAALTAVSPFQLMYAQEARTYALVAALTVASLWLFARAALLGRRRAWLPLALVTAAALYTQTIAALGIGVQAVFVALDPEARRRAKPWLLSMAGAVVLFAPWLAISLGQAGRLSESHWYIPAPGGHGIFQVLRAVFLSPVPLVRASVSGPRARIAQALLVVVPALPVLAAASGALTATPRGRILRFLFGALLLPLLAVLVVSFRSPLWLPRYFVLLTPPLAALLAIGATALRPRGLAMLAALALLVVSAYGCWRYDRDFDKEPWRAMAARILARGAGERALVLVPFDDDPMAYYLRRARPAPAIFLVGHPEVPFASAYTPRQLDELEAAARARAAGSNDVWVVIRSPNSAVRREVARRTEAIAASGRTLVERGQIDSMGGPLRYSRWRR